MSFVESTDAPSALGPKSRRPGHGAIAAGGGRPRRTDPAEQPAPRHSSRDRTLTPVPSAAPAAPAPAIDDSGQGLLLMTLSVGGSLTVVAAVALIALVPAAWVAGLAFVILLVMTAALVLAVLHATSS
jgi:hypothetical protein